jgi:hypothetical protein
MYPRNMVCFRYVIVNTPHTSDNKDDDDDDDDDSNNENIWLETCELFPETTGI